MFKLEGKITAPGLPGVWARWAYPSGASASLSGIWDFEPSRTLPKPSAGLCWSMKRAHVIEGRIEQHAEGFGTPTGSIVRKRAREIAVASGRRADQFSPDDWAQARRELEGSRNSRPDNADAERDAVLRDGVGGVSSGRIARINLASDEQALPENLVEEGVAEADHERMVAGNKESLRRDKRFDDQLGGSDQ
jgi:hypothetical protein